MDKSSTAPPPQRSRWRRGWRVFWLGVLGVLVLAVVFHRPLLRMAVRYAGPWLAAKQGLDLQWQVAGSIFGDVDLAEVKLGSGDRPWLEVEAGEISADYDLPALWKEGPESFLQRLTLHDVEAKLDLQALAEATADQAKPKEEKAPGKRPSLIWPESIDLDNVSLNLTLPDGRQMTLEGFHLQGGEGLPDRVGFSRFAQGEEEGLKLEGIEGDLDWGEQQATLRNLDLPLGIGIDRLHIDVSRMAEEGVAQVALAGRVGQGQIEADAALAWSPEGVADHELRVRAADLSAADVRPFGLPEEVAFDLENLGLKLEGDPANPQALTAQVDLRVGGLRGGGVKAQSLQATAQVAAGGQAEASADLEQGDNQMHLEAAATLPGSWADWEQTEWQARAKGRLPGATDLLEDPLPLEGSFDLDLTAQGRGSTPRELRGSLAGEAVAWQDYGLPKLESEFSLEGKTAHLRVTEAELGAGNPLTLNAELGLEKPHPLKADWQAEITDVAALLAALNRPPLPRELAGRLTVQGDAALDLDAVQAGNYGGVTAALSLESGNLSSGGATLEAIDLELAVAEGTATLRPSVLRVNADHAVEANGRVQLAAPWDFAAEVEGRLPALAQLSPLVETFGGPPLQGGAATLEVDLDGALQPWRSQGRVRVSLSDFATPAIPQPVSLELAADFAGDEITLNTLQAAMTPWQLQATGTANREQVALEDLTLLQGEKTLLTGRAAVPLDLTQPGATRPMDVALQADGLDVAEIARAAGVEGLPGGQLTARVDLKGRLETATGVVELDWKNLTVPQAPLELEPADVQVKADLGTDRVSLEGSVKQPPLQTLTLRGSAQTSLGALLKDSASWKAAPVDVAVRLPTSDLGFLRQLKPDMIADLPLTLSLDGRVTGTLGQPAINASLTANAPSIGFTNADLPSVRDVAVQIEANDSRITIRQLRALLAGGELAVTGTVDATDPAAPVMDLRLAAQEALIFRNADGTLRANADLTCSGPLASARLAGQVEAVRGRVFKEVDFIRFNLPNNLPPPPPGTTKSSDQIELPAFLHDWTFDVAVLTRDPVYITSNLAYAEIRVDARVDGTGANPRATGQARVENALLQLPFSLMRVERGIIELRPDAPLNPALDIRGTSRIDNYDVTALIFGTVKQPQTRFSSVPPLTEAQIASLIATGAVLDGSANDATARASSQAAFLLAQQLYRKVFDRDKVIRKEPPKFNLTYSPSGSDPNDQAIEATYDLNEHLRLSGRFRQSGGVRMLFSYLLRFGERVRAMDEENGLAEEVRP